MILESIYIDPDKSYSLLYQLLTERQPYESISHTGMPTWKEHSDFVSRKPYKGWYALIEESTDSKLNVYVGSIYLTYRNEIGIAVLNRYRRKGFATEAIKKLMDIHNEPFYLANINPINTKSIDLFKNLNFHIIQETYKLERKSDVVS